MVGIDALELLAPKRARRRKPEGTRAGTRTDQAQRATTSKPRLHGALLVVTAAHSARRGRPCTSLEPHDVRIVRNARVAGGGSLGDRDWEGWANIPGVWSSAAATHTPP